MPQNLTNAAEDLMLDWVNSVGTPTRPASPLKLALCTTAPTETTAGTEVTGGPGPYARQNANLGAASAGTATNTAEIRFSGMPAVTVTHVELWDNAGTVRVWYGILAAQKTTNSGDDFVIAANDLTVSLD